MELRGLSGEIDPDGGRLDVARHAGLSLERG